MASKCGAQHQDPVAGAQSRPQSPRGFPRIPVPSLPKVKLSTPSRTNSIATESTGRDSDHTDSSHDANIFQNEFKVLDEKSLTNLVDPWKSQMVLSLDSGGLRALSELHVLKALMCEVEKHEREKNASCSWASPLMLPTRTPDAEHSYLPCHYFDYVGGASLGGLCAIMLGRLRMSVDETIQAVENLSKSEVAKRERLIKVPRRKLSKRSRMQNRSANTDVLVEKLRPYLLERNIAPELNLDKLNFEKLFSSKLQATDDQRCKSLTFVDASDRGNPFLFRSYVTNTSRSFDIELIQAARYTLGKPPSPRGSSQPGCRSNTQNGSSTAVFPAWNVYDQVFKDVSALGAHTGIPFSSFKALGAHAVPSAHIALLVSIGSPASITPSRDKVTTKSKAKQISQQESTKLEAKLHESAEKNAFFYERIPGPQGLSKIMPNEWNMNCSPEMLGEIRDITRRHCASDDISAKLRRCARALVEARHQRAQTRHWERFALGTDYICRFCPDPAKGPGRKPQFHGDQYSLIEHLQREHDAPPPDASLYDDYLEILKNFRVTAQRQ